MNRSRQNLGKRGEALAAQHLLRRGWRVLGRNLRSPYGEIDVVARDAAGVLVFVEVRARSSRAFGTPEESITPAKRERMARCALDYLSRTPQPDQEWRIDLVAIELVDGRVARLEHHEHVLQ
jgi:putative endonuclease